MYGPKVYLVYLNEGSVTNVEEVIGVFVTMASAINKAIQALIDELQEELYYHTDSVGDSVGKRLENAIAELQKNDPEMRAKLEDGLQVYAISTLDTIDAYVQIEPIELEV